MRRHLAALDGLRAVAVFAVLTTHVAFLSGATGGRVLPGLLSRMDIGVAFFFVLSGFLLYTPHVRAGYSSDRSPNIRRYALHRVTRIVPAWLILLPATLLLVREARGASAWHWLANVLMIQTLRSDWAVPGLNHLWSLSTEMAFYLVLPALAWGIARGSQRLGGRSPRRELALLALVVLASWAWRLASLHGLLGLSYDGLQWLPATLDWFVAGMALAVLRQLQMNGHSRVSSVVAVVRESAVPLRLAAVLLLWVATTRLAGPYDLRVASASEDVLKHVLYAVTALLVVAPCALGAQDGFTRLLASGPLTWLGRISYGIFLWHLPVLYLVRSTLGVDYFAGEFWPSWLITAAASIAVASASWYILERPLMDRVRRGDHRPRVTAAAEEPVGVAS